MKRNSTFVRRAMLCALLTLPFTSFAQFAPGLPAAFGIDGDVLSGQSQNISGTTPQYSFDWFQKPGGAATAGVGVIDTTGAGVLASQVASGQNITFSRGMAYPRYSTQNGYLLLDARYSRDNFGYSNAPGQNDFTTYTNGAKNGDDPATWSTTPTGATVSDKADIIDTYAHMRRDGTVINNTNPSALILALGVSTVGNTGNRFVDFELFHSRIQYNGTTGIFSNSGPTAKGGHTEWEFNADGSVSAIGDMTVSFSYGTAGVSEIGLYIWVSSASYNNISPTRFSFAPNEFYGAAYGYAKVMPIAAINQYKAWGSASTGNTPGPIWGTNSKTNGGASTNYSATTYAASDFAEVAIDLTSMGIDPALSVGMNPCSPPFTRVIAKSRSSVSFTSALQDFTGPYEFLDAPEAAPQIATPAMLNCKAPSIQLSPASPVSGASYQWTTPDGNIISDPNTTNVLVNKPGKYYLTTAVVNGCPTKTDSTMVNADFYKPVATAIFNNGSLTLGTAKLLGGDTALSNVVAHYGGSTGLTWNWTGPNGITATTQNITPTLNGTYTLILTEKRNGCTDTTTVIPLTSTGGPLPVTYVSFNAVVVDNKYVDLKWITASEINHSHFEVERAFDANTFHTIGLVLDGITLNGTDKSYQFTDKSAELLGKATIYYRLKQFDIDGRVTYSKVVAVKLNADRALVMQVSPNPFVENVYVNFTATEKGVAELSIINAAGQTVLTKQAIVIKGYNNLQVEGLRKFNTGLYVARLTINGNIIGNQKIIKN